MSKKFGYTSGKLSKRSMQCHVDNRLARYYDLEINICSENKRNSQLQPTGARKIMIVVLIIIC